MKRWTIATIILVALLLLVGTGMAALAAGNSPLAGTKIVVAVRSLPETDFIVSRIAEFEKQTGIKVTLVTYAEQQLREKEVQDLSTGAGTFDVIALDSVYIPEFARNGWLVPIEKYLPKSYDVKDIKSSVRGLLSLNGQLYGAPVYAEITQLMYRKDLFEKAGLTPPKTMDELVAAAKRFTEAPNMYGIAMRGLRGNGMNVYTWVTWLRSYGGEFLGKDSTPIFNDARGIEATNNYAELLKNYGPPGVASYSWDDVQTAFTSGKVAMIIDANNFYNRIEDPTKSTISGKIGYAVVPKGPAGAFPANYALGFAISKVGARTEKEKQASAEFLAWATSQQMQEAAIDQGIVSVTRATVLDGAKFKSKVDKAWLESTNKSWDITKPNIRPRFTQWREMGDLVGIAVQQVLSGEKSAKDALTGAAAATADILKKAGVYGKPRPYQL